MSGLLVILYVAGHMIYRAVLELLPYVTGRNPKGRPSTGAEAAPS